MSAFTEALAASVKPKGPICGVKAYAAKLAAEPTLPLTVDEFTDAIADQSMTASILSRALHNLAKSDPRVPELGQHIITYHRRDDCGCNK